MGEGEQIATLLSTPALTMVRLAWVKLLLFTVPQLQAEKALILNEGGIYRCRTVHRVVLRAQGTPTHCSASDARVLGHMARECATPAKMLNQDEGTQGNVVKPPTTISKFTTFPLWPQTKTDPSKGSE